MQCDLCDCKMGEGWCGSCAKWLSRSNAAAERQQLKRDRRKAGLVLVQEWVPADKADAVRAAMVDAVNSEARRAAVAPGKAKIGVDSKPMAC